MNIFDRLSIRVVVACVCVLLASAPEAVGKDRGALRKILNEQESGFAEFGSRLALDGEIAVIGAPGHRFAQERERGSALVFDVGSGELLYELMPPADATVHKFGDAVDICGDIVAVSARGIESGSCVYVYDLEDGALLYTLQPEGLGSKAGFGGSLALQHPYLLVGASNETIGGVSSGAVYVYDASSGSLLRKLIPSDGTDLQSYGSFLALDGNIALIGAPGDEEVFIMTGAVYVVDITDGTLLRKMLPPRGFINIYGRDLAISGNIVVMGDTTANYKGQTSGAAWVFDLSTGEPLHILVPDDGARGHYFGGPIVARGRMLVIGAIGYNVQGQFTGAVYIFDAKKGVQLSKLTVDTGNNRHWFGATIAVSDSHILVGAPADNELGFKAGAAYVFEGTMPQDPADFNGDDCVDVKDLRLLLGAWGGQDALLDISRNGVVDSVDLAKVLLSWGCE